MSEKGQGEPAFSAKDLGHFRTLRVFREKLATVLESHELAASFHDPRRRLELGDYLGLMLFGLLNPVAGTLRGLEEASRIKKVQRDVCKHPTSLGSLSEVQHLVDVEILEKVFAELSAEHCASRGAGIDGKARHVKQWLAQDSSVWAALPRMAWALYGGGRVKGSKAVRLHLSFHVGADAPASALVSEGRKCERAALREQLKAGSAYVADRYYGMDYKLFDDLERKGCSYCFRLRDTAEVEVIEELEVSKKDKDAGVLRQALVRLGTGKWRSSQLRVVYVKGVSGEILMLATNLGPEELTGAEVAALYKHRWSIEYFFRWVKCVMGCGHWMAESRNGVSIQIYLALIGSLLLQLQLGRRPSKRIWELLQWHQTGCLEDGELTELLERRIAVEQRQRNKKPPKPFWKKG